MDNQETIKLLEDVREQITRGDIRQDLWLLMDRLKFEIKEKKRNLVEVANAQVNKRSNPPTLPIPKKNASYKNYDNKNSIHEIIDALEVQKKINEYLLGKIK